MKKVVFIGSKKLGISVLEEMYRIAPNNLFGVITIDDSQDIRCALESFRQFSKKSDKPIRVLSKSSDLKAAISEFSPDICIMVGWYWIVKQELLDMVPEGWLGIHASLLPKYRGGSPLVWAIINGERESGISLFYFDNEIDTGDIVAQKRIEIGIDETISDILLKVQSLSVEVIRETYNSLIDGTAPRIPQDHSHASYVAPRKPTDGRIDWNLRNVQIYDFIRAQTHPYPGAFCFTPFGETLRIWKAKTFPYPYYGTAGSVMMVKEDHVVATCGNGTAICLYTVQVENQGEKNATQVLKYGMRLT